MLKQRIQSGSTNALKQSNKEVAGVLRMTLAAIISKEKEKRYKISKQEPDLKEEDLVSESQLTNEEIIDVISSEIKKRKDAIALYKKGNRQELADKEKREVEILQEYLPEQLSEDELKKLIHESIEKVGAKEMKDMGKIMQDLMPEVKGRADNAKISMIVKELLSK